LVTRNDVTIAFFIPNALNSPTRLFADDACLITHTLNSLVLNEKVNHELVNIYEWTKANKITVNSNKSDFTD